MFQGLSVNLFRLVRIFTASGGESGSGVFGTLVGVTGGPTGFATVVTPRGIIQRIALRFIVSFSTQSV